MEKAPVKKALTSTKTGKARAYIRRYWYNKQNIAQGKEKKYNTGLCIQIPHVPGKLGEVSSLIGIYDCNIVNMEILEKKTEYLEFIFDIQVKDLKKYTNLISELKLKEYKFKIIRHRKKDALLLRIFKNFKKIDIILSPAIGGIVIGYEIGRQLDLETIFAERLKGELKLRRDFSIKKNSNVLVVEDVITTGKSALECVQIVKENKANLVGFACIIDRSSSNSLIKDEIVSQIKFKIETFKPNELPEDLKNIPAIKPGSNRTL